MLALASLIVGCIWGRPESTEPTESELSIEERTAARIDVARRFAQQPFLPMGGPALWGTEESTGSLEAVGYVDPALYPIGGLPREAFHGDVHAGLSRVEGWSAYTDLVERKGAPVVAGFRQHGIQCDRIDRYLRETYGPPVTRSMWGWIWDAVTYVVQFQPAERTSRRNASCVVRIDIQAPEAPPPPMFFNLGEVHWYRPKLDPERRGVFGRAWHDAVQRFLTDQPVPRYTELTDVEQEELRKTLTALRLPFEAPVQWLERPPPEEFPGRIGKGPRPRAWPWKLRIYEGPPPRPAAE